jgi:hypothetical protein
MTDTRKWYVIVEYGKAYESYASNSVGGAVELAAFDSPSTLVDLWEVNAPDEGLARLPTCYMTGSLLCTARRVVDVEKEFITGGGQ